MVAEVNEQSAVSRRAFLVGMVATGVAVQTKDAIAEDDNKPPTFQPNIVHMTRWSGGSSRASWRKSK
jgi:hypothetical protein